MRTTWAIVGLMLVGMLAGGCDKEEQASGQANGSTRNLNRGALHEAMVGKLEELATTLAKVKDQASAEKLAPKVTAIADELKKIGRQLQSLGSPTSQETRDLDQQYGARRKAALSAIETEGKRIEADAKLDAVGQALEQIRGGSGGADD